MKHLVLFETFIELPAKDKNFKKGINKIDTIYEDENLSVKVVKSLQASKSISDPQWCSTTASGFYKHNLTSNLYRFIFKDGYKLRLTWDYLDWDQNYTSGTHWGAGGTLPGGWRVNYSHIRPRDENHPFEFDYQKYDDRQYMVDKINSIPKKAIEAAHKYQDQHKAEKNSLYLKLYKEIEKIKVINVITKPDTIHQFEYRVMINYLGKEFVLVAYVYSNRKDIEFRFYQTSFEKFFKNRYAFMESKTINEYLSDKTIEWLKLNKNREYLKLRGVPIIDDEVYIDDQSEDV